MTFTLDRVVREYIAGDLGMEDIDRRYARFLLLGSAAIRNLTNDNVGNVQKEVLLDVNDNDTITLPSDFIDYYAIGMCSGGELVSLGLNSNLCDISKDDCGNRSTPTVIPSGSNIGGVFYSQSDYNDKGENLGKHFGVGGGRSNIGEYKVYPDKGYIALNGYTGSQIVLRYKADLSIVNGDIIVHPYNVQAVKDYIWWKYISKSKGYGLGDKASAKQEWKDSKKKAQKQSYSLSIREIVSAYKSGYRSSPGI
jgi:hypothetical protein